MSENSPILYQNILSGLPDQIAKDAFLWAVERPGEDRYCYRAENFAHEVSDLVRALRPMIALAADKHEQQHGQGLDDAGQEDLLQFFLQRHANWRFGGNVSADYAKAWRP